MERLRLGLAICALLLGAAHIAFGLFVFPELNLEMIWFIGAGVAMMVTAIVNIGGDGGQRTQRHVINGLMSAYALAILSQAQLPQVYLAVVLFGGLFVLSFRPIFTHTG